MANWVELLNLYLNYETKGNLEILAEQFHSSQMQKK